MKIVCYPHNLKVCIAIAFILPIFVKLTQNNITASEWKTIAALMAFLILCGAWGSPTISIDERGVIISHYLFKNLYSLSEIRHIKYQQNMHTTYYSGKGGAINNGIVISLKSGKDINVVTGRPGFGKDGGQELVHYYESNLV